VFDTRLCQEPPAPPETIVPILPTATTVFPQQIPKRSDVVPDCCLVHELLLVDERIVPESPPMKQAPKRLKKPLVETTQLRHLVVGTEECNIQLLCAKTKEKVPKIRTKLSDFFVYIEWHDERLSMILFIMVPPPG
jgi:hypothetical protein